MVRVDPYNAKEVYCVWWEGAKDGVSGVCGEGLGLIRRFLSDMEQGRNVARGSRRGPRSYVRLNSLRVRLVFLARVLLERCGCSLARVSEEQVHGVFLAMRSGEIRRRDGGVYRSVGDYVKAFRAFWNWFMRVSRRRGVVVDDICVDLDDSREKPPWVYLSEEQVRLLCVHAKYEYRVLLLFLFDSGIRSPTELLNVRVRDLREGCSRLVIREESSKTFGRTINLLLSADVLGAFVRECGLGEMDCVFSVSPACVNRYLKRLAVRVLGEGVSPGGSRYSEISMYDLRHSSACYWLQRYKSESALKYRFGWKKSEMIHYYTEFVGMRDTITQDDLLVDAEKTVIEQRLVQSEREKGVLAERVRAMEEDMQRILCTIERLTRKLPSQ